MTLLSLVDLQIVVGLAAGKTQAQIGEELNLEQPAISKLLKAAESRTGLHLVEQHGRRLGLSAAGGELAKAAAQTLGAFEDVRRLSLDLRSGDAGPVRVMTSTTPGNYVLPALVSSFLAECPRAEVQLHISPNSTLWEAFEEERCDFAVLPQLGISAALKVCPLYNDPVVFFARYDAPIVARDTVTLADLHSETIVGKFVDQQWTLIFRELERSGFRAAQRFTISPPEAVKRMVLAGLGVGVLFESSIRAELDAGTLVRLPIGDLSLQQVFCTAMPPHQILAPVAERFLTYLREHLSAT
jgi:DNA-binding transcriptional LysR family regulator